MQGDEASKRIRDYLESKYVPALIIICITANATANIQNQFRGKEIFGQVISNPMNYNSFHKLVKMYIPLNS